MEKHSLVYVQHVGKVGTRTVRQGFLEPHLCEAFYPYKNVGKTLHYPRTWLPKGCLAYLARNRIYYPPKSRRQTSSYVQSFTIFTFLRNPMERAASVYLWSMPGFGNDAKKLQEFPFEHFLENADLLRRYGRSKNPSWHWLTQTEGLLRSNVPRVDFLGCVHSLRKDFNSLVSYLNARSGVESGTIPSLPSMPVSSFRHQAPGKKAKNQLMERLQESPSLQQKVCSGYYSVDCKLIPCSLPTFNHTGNLREIRGYLIEGVKA